MKMQVAVFLASYVHIYLHARFVCRFNETKYSYSASMLISLAWQTFGYLTINTIIANPQFRCLAWILFYSMYGVIVLTGKIIHRMIKVLAISCLYVLLDMMCAYVFFPWMNITLDNAYTSSNLVLARNVYNMIIYLLTIIMEVIANRKEASHLNLVSLLSASLAFCQIMVMSLLFQTNLEKITSEVVMFSIFYSGIMIQEHFVIMELFQQIVRQERKRKELEEKGMERQYQYHYYLLAREQGEQIRDLRHDMRNQLQAIQSLIRTEKEEDAARAEKMLADLEQKTGFLEG